MNEPPLNRITPLDRRRWTRQATRKARLAGIGVAGALWIAWGATQLAPFALIAPLAGYAAGRAIERGQIQHLFRDARSVGDFRTLEALDDRTLVRLRGRVRMITPLIAETKIVAHRIMFQISARPYSHEGFFWQDAAQDFALADTRGAEIPVDVRGAELFPRWRWRRAEPVIDGPQALQALGITEVAGLPTGGINFAKARGIADGQWVEVVGVKSREAAPVEGILRETPSRTVICSGHVPLVIFW